LSSRVDQKGPWGVGVSQGKGVGVEVVVASWEDILNAGGGKSCVVCVFMLMEVIVLMTVELPGGDDGLYSRCYLE
jgi:hypothetical protein